MFFLKLSPIGILKVPKMVSSSSLVGSVLMYGEMMKEECDKLF